MIAAQGEGLASLCFRTHDIAKMHRRLDRLALSPEPVAEAESRDAISGVTLSWKRTRAATEATRGVRLFFVELARERPLSVRTIPASITAMDHVVISTADPERAAALYGARLGLDMALDRSHPDWGRLMFFRCGDLIVEIVHRPDADADQARDRLWGMSWRVADIDATRARLVSAGVEVSEVRPGRKPGTRVLTRTQRHLRHSHAAGGTDGAATMILVGDACQAVAGAARFANERCIVVPGQAGMTRGRRVASIRFKGSAAMNKPVLPVASLSLKLPNADRGIETYRLAGSRTYPSKLQGTLNRVAFSAAHVVADPLADVDPWLCTAIDWDRTIAFREHVWDLGLGVAEAMDTAQRGMGLDWPTSLELIRRSVAAARARGQALVFSGAGTDQLAPQHAKSLNDVIRAYEEQIAAIEKAGGRIILMASRALARLGRDPDDYARVYDRVLSQVREPVIIHWLGDMFDPALANYWGTAQPDQAMDVALGIINAHAAKVDGVKVSLLDMQREIDMRRRLDRNVKMYTGDDFNYAELIAGDSQGFSHALLGIFDAIAPAASYALSRLAAGDDSGFRDVLEPTVPLSRHIFRAPTRFYKTGVVFMAYLNGHQDHFTMVGGQESARSTLHLAELFRLADQAGLLADPELATRRMRAVLALRGIES